MLAKRSNKIILQVVFNFGGVSALRFVTPPIISGIMIDKGILEKTLEFAPGEWLLSSYIATGMENVPYS